MLTKQKFEQPKSNFFSGLILDFECASTAVMLVLSQASSCCAKHIVAGKFSVVISCSCHPQNAFLANLMESLIHSILHQGESL